MNGGYQMSIGGLLSWGGFGSGPDAALARNAAGVVEINNGTAGTFRDLQLRNLKASGLITNYNGVATAGLGVAMIPGVDNRLGLTAVDGAPITIYAVPAGTGKLFRITADINGTAAIAGTWTYTLTYTENAQTKTLAVTATVLNTLGTATDLIHPDGSTNITAQLTSTGGATGTLSVGGVAEQLA